MTQKPFDHRPGHLVLIVDDVPENLAVLHDALDESGFTVLVANSGPAAIARASEVVPDIILLDAVMPGMDGFEVCRQLRAQIATRHIPVIFMTGLTETEHVVAAFNAGGTDYVTKPVRQSEVIARISSHLQTALLMNQARSALDAFGNAVLAIAPQSGRIVWQTPLARQLMRNYFAMPGEGDLSETPAELVAWLAATARARGMGQEQPPLNVIQGATKLIFSAADVSGGEQWMVVLREESDTAQVQALMALFKLTQRESEVLHWVIKGKTNRDIGDILGTSPRTVNKHLEHVFVKLGVETRTAAASLAMTRVRAVVQEGATDAA
ncbi:response regulator [Pseudoduganella namucuonensis]|uniref:Two component transcriptional regulator, LuxR family n=1 Tax=Pseudoduganella namucuonensis TaxID=1035707 RepID=A0A1I7FWR0_9BURK|nr:response regulator [Pseudoduganella namucuonensis]SFU40476.1 two component transcriptional regulator, LuxR family [Pseudoduganella namucuonensis]